MADSSRENDPASGSQPPHERRDLYEDDLTDERLPSPVTIEEAAHTEVLDPERDSDEPNVPYKG